MYDFVSSVSVAQEQRVTGFPLWEEYMNNRIHTIGIYPCLTAME